MIAAFIFIGELSVIVSLSLNAEGEMLAEPERSGIEGRLREAIFAEFCTYGMYVSVKPAAYRPNHHDICQCGGAACSKSSCYNA